MRQLLLVAVSALIWLIAGPGFAQSTYNGPMRGSITGTLTNASGQTITPDCSANVQYLQPSGPVATVTVNGSGTCSGGGASYNFTFTSVYNTASQNLTGTYVGPSGDSATLTFTKTGNLTWSANLRGTAPSSTGPRTAELTIVVELPAEAANAGINLADLRKSGTINFSQGISIPISAPIINLNTTVSNTITVNGSWTIYFVPTANGGWDLNGYASGTVTFASPISFTGSVTVGNGIASTTVPVPVSITVTCNWGGNLYGTLGANNMRFVGSWVGSTTQTAQGSVATVTSVANTGGTVEISMPVDLTTGAVPTMIPSFTGNVGAAINGSTLTMPLTFSGNVPLVVSN